MTRRQQLTRMHTRLAAQIARDHQALSNVLYRDVFKTFEWFGHTCAATFQIRIGHPTFITAQSVPVSTKLDATILAQQIVDAVLGSMMGRLSGDFERGAKRTLARTIKTLNDVTGIGAGVSDPAQERIFTNAGKRVGLVDIEQAARNSIFRAIDEGNQLGVGPIAIARNIRDYVPAGPFVNAGAGYRSQVISRTETNWAQNSSTITAYRESDVVEMCVAMDGDDDPECAARDGQEFSFDDAETEMGNEHPNGTLCFAPVITGDSGEQV